MHTKFCLGIPKGSDHFRAVIAGKNNVDMDVKGMSRGSSVV
jgi:hypothetical protein